jgi:hypothetical protein
MTSDTEHTTTEGPEREMERGAEEPEEGIERLGEHIEDAEKATERRAEVVGEGVGGDWEDTDDDAGGEDPSGFDDPESDEEDEEEDESA